MVCICCVILPILRICTYVYIVAILESDIWKINYEFSSSEVRIGQIKKASSSMIIEVKYVELG